MSTFWEPTRAGSERKTKMITLDSESYFTSSNSTSISNFIVKLDSPLHITNSAVIYLEGVFIGGFKSEGIDSLSAITGNMNTTDQGKDVTHFNLEIPEFDITTYAGNPSKSSSVFSGKFTIPNEKFGSVAGTPFIKAYLSRTAVYVSSIQAKTLSSITVNVTDQNGKSIFYDDANNPLKNRRRIVLQFIVAENLK